MEADTFGLYLLRELLWELSKFGVTVTGLTDVPREKIEVLSYHGYDILRLRVAGVVFEAQLDWSTAAPPLVERLAENGGKFLRPPSDV